MFGWFNQFGNGKGMHHDWTGFGGGKGGKNRANDWKGFGYQKVGGAGPKGNGCDGNVVKLVALMT